MKLVSKSSKHDKKTSAPAPALRPEEQIIDEAYWDDMLADILGTKTEAAKTETKKASASVKTEAPVTINSSAKPAAPVKPATPAKPVVAEKPKAPSFTETFEKPKEPVKAEKLPEIKEPTIDETAGIFFSDEWDDIFSKPKKEKSAPEQKKEKKAPQTKKEVYEPEKKTKKQKSGSVSWGMVKSKPVTEDENGLIDFDDTKKKKPKKKRSFLGKLGRLFIVLLVLLGLYLFFVYTKIPFVASLRDAYIETAMSTMSHQWMAEWFFPQDVIDEVVNRVETAQQSQEGMESNWNKKKDKDKDKDKGKDKNKVATEEDFYELFWELDKNTFEDYLNDHPETLDNGWGGVYINEAGLDDNGTSIWTKMDEQVLAIDVPNRILLVRVQGSGYQGVLAVAKDSSRLSCTAAQNVGSYGERLENIMQRTGAVLGMTGSGFIDEGGNGSGGEIVGYALCEGKELGKRVGYPYKRIELREDNLLYVVDSDSEVNKKTTDAVEFAPALVINGEALIGQLSGYTSINPRACLGQSDKGEVLMLVIEGRLPSRSFGCGLPECTEILMQHNAYQAMNLDGGTSAIMWYRGEYVIKCSNTAITCRTLPNAWIYSKEPLD